MPVAVLAPVVPATSNSNCHAAQVVPELTEQWHACGNANANGSLRTLEFIPSYSS